MVLRSEKEKNLKFSFRCGDAIPSIDNRAEVNNIIVFADETSKLITDYDSRLKYWCIIWYALNRIVVKKNGEILHILFNDEILHTLFVIDS